MKGLSNHPINAAIVSKSKDVGASDILNPNAEPRKENAITKILGLRKSIINPMKKAKMTSNSIKELV